MGPAAPVDETWAQLGTLWFELTPSVVPRARADHRLAYQPHRHQVLLFGGDDGRGQLGDAWEWNGSSWTQQFSAHQPPERSEHAMAYDAVRERVVLFGGRSEMNTAYGDTWEWSGSDWSEIPTSSGPSAQFDHAMAFDGQRIVLFGVKCSSPLNAGTCVSETWTWDGTDWVLQHPPLMPSARQQVALAFDPDRKRVVLFGGYFAGDTYAETWEWDGTTWHWRPIVRSPPKLANGQLIFNAETKRIQLFDGHIIWTYLP